MMSPEIYVGTSGWSYSWNPGGLDWYVENSGFNAVELNMSFYSFPRERQVAGWARRGARLRWMVKAHRSITHLRKLRPEALDTWRRFRDRFSPLEDLVDFYLFQLPPSMRYSKENLERIGMFAEDCEKVLVEFRHRSWFREGIEDDLSAVGAYLVTPDSPMFEGLPHGRVYKVMGAVYVRMHGRLAWYNYGYLDEELEEVASRCLETGAERVYVFFNNNHDMLHDGRRMLDILSRHAASG